MNSSQEDHTRLNFKELLLPLAMLFFFIFSFQNISEAAQLNLEKDLQNYLKQSRHTAQKAKEKQKEKHEIKDEVKFLKSTLKDVKELHQLLLAKFTQREAELQALGPLALERHRAMVASYQEALDEYINFVESLPSSGKVSEDVIEELNAFLDRILYIKKIPIYGSLPYKHMNLPSREPTNDPDIQPAYKGGTTSITTEDLEGTEEAPLSLEIATLAQSLDWNPVSIYEYVKNNIETEWYWGCMKGAEETLRQKSGNDCDQAALLVALLRASGFPSRYVRGVIEFFPDIEKVKNLTGINDPVKIATFFQKAGIPFKPIISGGQIRNFQIEHIWVESYIPYANYRGAIIDEYGKTWIGLDTSIKPRHYQYNNPLDILLELSLTNVREEYLGAVQSKTPLEYVKTDIDAYLSQQYPDASYSELLRTKTITPEVMNILPASLQFNQTKITHEYTEIPNALKQQVRFTATDMNNQELFSITLDALELSNKKIALSYEPETMEDQMIINSYGGLGSTPSYLVRLRPVLKVNGDRLVVGEDGLLVGADYYLDIEIISPLGVEKTTNVNVAGNLSVVGIVAQRAIEQEEIPLELMDAEELIYKEAINYIDRWNQAEEEFASLTHLVFTRPIPTVVTTGGVIDVTYFLDMPHGFEWKGAYVDADFRSIETVNTAQNPEDRQKIFMELSGLQGSILENRIFEDDWEVESISTAKLISLANSNQIPVLIIDETNLDTVLPTLPFAEDIKEDITNAVNQNLTVTIPDQEMTYEDWTGIGYIKENPATGETGYMLSGMIAGGETAITPEEWANQWLAEQLGNPFAGEFNQDPLAASRIIKIPVTDRQFGIVGQQINEPLAVLVVDGNSIPVKGASVTFEIIAGGGTINNEETYTITTAQDGIAKVPLILGTKTSDNPEYMKINPEDEFDTQIGLNLVTASVSSSSGDIYLDNPFNAYGKPDEPASLIKGLGDGNRAIVNSPGGSLSVKVADQYENPISNVSLTFNTEPAISQNPSVPLPANYRNLKFYKQDECDNPYPIYGECTNYYDSLDVKTGYSGSIVWTVIGNTVNTEYTVNVTTENLPPVTFKLYSLGNMEDPGDYAAPGVQMGYISMVNEQGESINASLAGTPLNVPVSAGLFMYYADYTVGDSFTCEVINQPTTCWRIQPAGTISTQKITDGTVAFTPIVGDGYATATENLLNGIYQTWFTTGPAPAVNVIEAEGEAAIQVPEVFYDSDTDTYVATSQTPPTITVTLKSGQTVLFSINTGDPVIPDTDPPTQKLEYTVFGVDIQLEIEPHIIVLNNEGYTISDTVFTYTIMPPEYNAIIADIDFFMVDQDNNETWAGSVGGSETQGVGNGVLVRGTHFDISKNYRAQVVLNYGSGIEIRGEKVPLLLTQSSIIGQPLFSVDRTYHLNQFDPFIEWSSENAYTDGYASFGFSLQEPADVSLKIFDSDFNEKGAIVPQTSLSSGSYNFIIDYKTISDFGFSSMLSPSFYLLLEVGSNDGAIESRKIYPGEIAERTDGKMLGQTIVHDVLIQDGSLNLSRQDAIYKGRGPQFEFTRAYNNQPSGRGQKPLGEGWSHSLDMKLLPMSTAENGIGTIPDWVNNLKGQFFTSSDIPQNPEGWTVVLVNGTMFKKYSGTWYAERGRHGSLEEVNGSFIYTSKDGTKYTYGYPLLVPAPVQSIEDRNGNAMTFSYDSFNRLETVTDASGRIFSFEYADLAYAIDLYGSRLVRVAGPDGLELSFTYNDRGYLESAMRDARIETYEYMEEPGIQNSGYNLVKATDANGNSYTYEYYGPDEVDPNLVNFIRVLKSQDVIKHVQYPDSNFATFQYDVQTENKRIVTDLRGNDTVYTLNFFGNPQRIDEPEGKVTFMTWSIGQGLNDNVMTSKTDARGNTTQYEYDAKGNITRETDPYVNSITTVWNQLYSLPEIRTDRNNISQSWQYDAKGNLERYTDGDNMETTYTYYPTGERKTMTYPRGNTTSYTYDQYGNPDTVTEPEGSITDYDYDIRGRLSVVTDPKGYRTVYTYNALDYTEMITHPLISAYSLPSGSSNIQRFNYDPVGNLLSETDRNGLTLTYTYTPRNQVKTITRNIGGTKTFSYDANGNLLTETDWKGVVTSHTYDNLNRRITTTNRLNYTMSMSYDLNGNLLEGTDYEGRKTNYEYDKLNRLTDTWQPALDGQPRGNIHNTYYNEADTRTNLKSVTDQEGNTTSYEYNGRYLLVKRTDALTNTLIREYDSNGNMTKETDEEGNYTQFVYDKQNRRILMTQMGDIQTQYDYDANGNIIQVTDPRGNLTQTSYDKWNRAYQVTDADNYVTTTEYDGEGNKVKVIDGNGNQRTWQRDARGLVLRYTDAESKATVYTYDQKGNVGTMTDARGTVTSNTYDAEDRLATTTEAYGTSDVRIKEILSRDKMGNPLQVKDYNGNVTVTEYNALYLPKRVYDPAPFNSSYTETTYYKTGKVKTVRNRRGYITTHEYDALNRETKVTDAKTQTIETTYDKVSNVKTVKDKRGIITENFYDALYRLIRTERAGIRLVTNEYDDAGNLTAVIDANNNRTDNAYNNRNLLATTLYPDGTTQQRTYDGVGNLLTLTDEEGKVTTYTYDKENRQTSVEFAGEITENTYDVLGNLTAVTKPMSNQRTMAYDRINRLITVTDDPGGLNLITRYQYDANGNQRHQYNARGNHVEITYDSLNRKTNYIQHKASGNLVTQYGYDQEGNLTQVTDPMGQIVTYTYDELNMQKDAVYPDITTPYITIRNIHTEYDQNNNVLSVTETKEDSGGSPITDTTINTYDNFDRIDTSTQRGLTVDYAYDNNGNRTSVSTPAGTTTYTYDSRNRIETATAGGQVTYYTYYPDGKTDTVTYPNGTDMKYTYHLTNRVETITNNAGASVISSYTYDYDLNGNRISQVELQSGVTETTTYNYDNADRLNNFTVTGDTDTTTTAYTFEGYNRKTETVTQNGTVTKSRAYTYDETDWLTRIDDISKTITYEYNDNGNMISKSDSSLPNDDMTFIYDSRNQLVEVKRGPTGSETILGRYDYNSDGLRVRHRLSERGDVDYYFDENAVIEERNASDGSLLAHYRYADRLLSLDSGAGKQYYHYDALGSTVNLTDGVGGIQVSYQLDPWGHIRNQIGLSVNRHIFTGQEHDENTGLIYFGARYYDPDTARFITQDTYLGESGTPPSLHRYLYAYSNPTVYVDLMGYWSWKEISETVSYFTNPLKLPTKLASVSLEYVNERIDEYAESSSPGTLELVGLTTVKTATTVAKGFVDMPEQIESETEEFIKAPELENIPILGGVGTALGTTSYECFHNPNLVSCSQFAGAVSSAGLLVAPMLPKGPKISLRGAVAEEATVGANVARQAAIAKNPTLPQITREPGTIIPKLKTKYKESYVANQEGAVGKRSISKVEKEIKEIVPREKTYRDLLKKEEIVEFKRLKKQYPEWMPDLNAPAKPLAPLEVRAARIKVKGKGHHKEPLAFGGEPNPLEGLVKTGETRIIKNPIHKEISKFWYKALQRIRKQEGVK